MPEEKLDKKVIIKAVIIAVIAALVALALVAFLGWQYRQIEKKRLPAIEQAIEEQKEAAEERLARDTLRQFMLARISQDEKGAVLYLTENAMKQAELGEFFLLDNIGSYEIIDSEKTAEHEYRFAVIINYESIPGEHIEIIILIKIQEMNDYFIDSVQIAG